MLKAITISRSQGRRRDDGEVLDALEFLAATKYGSAVNAAVQIIRQSEEFAAALQGARKQPPSGGRRTRH